MSNAVRCRSAKLWHRHATLMGSRVPAPAPKSRPGVPRAAGASCPPGLVLPDNLEERLSD